MAAQQLRDGLSDVTVLRGGIEQWREIRLAGRRSATATFASSPRRAISARPADRAATASARLCSDDYCSRRERRPNEATRLAANANRHDGIVSGPRASLAKNQATGATVMVRKR